jgi:hypothetical protein
MACSKIPYEMEQGIFSPNREFFGENRVPAICNLQGDFEEMQGEPDQFLAESHCAVRSSEDSSLSKEQGGVAGIAGKSRDVNGPDAGITDRPEQRLRSCRQKR